MSVKHFRHAWVKHFHHHHNHHHHHHLHLRLQKTVWGYNNTSSCRCSMAGNKKSVSLSWSMEHQEYDQLKSAIWNISCCLVLGLGSIRAASMDRQSRTIDVHHERTSIAELDTAPPTSIVFPTPKTQKNLPYSLKWQRRWGGDSRPPLKRHYDRYYRAR